MIGVDEGLVAELAHGLGPDYLAALQAHAAGVAADEERDAGEQHAAEALLDRLEAAAALHLLVGGQLLLRVAELEEGPPVASRSHVGVRYIARMRRRYRRLRVLGRATNARDGRARYRVSCSCGSPPLVTLGASLRSGKTRSCGCLRDERLREMVANRRRAA